MKTELTAEAFLRQKLESEIQDFGDGNTKFHTRDLEHLLECLDEKDQQTASLREENEKLTEINNSMAEKVTYLTMRNLQLIGCADAMEEAISEIVIRKSGSLSSLEKVIENYRKIKEK